MEIDNLEKFALSIIDYLEKRIEKLQDENEQLEKRNNEWLTLWNDEYKRAERLEGELDRAVKQMAELEAQMERVCDRYNTLARESTSSLVKDFEPVKVGNDA